MPGPVDRTPLHTGGCQCGAVRFAFYSEPLRIGICHCRMCQKAAGAPFMALADVPFGNFAWTRGAPATFRSSSRADRDFCARCGTPLAYRQVGGANIEVTCAAFDQPERVAPAYAVGTESKLAWFDGLAALPGRPTSAEAVRTVVSYQHPDHDTADGWAPPSDPSRA